MLPPETVQVCRHARSLRLPPPFFRLRARKGEEEEESVAFRCFLNGATHLRHLRARLLDARAMGGWIECFPSSLPPECLSSWKRRSASRSRISVKTVKGFRRRYIYIEIVYSIVRSRPPPLGQLLTISLAQDYYFFHPRLFQSLKIKSPRGEKRE